MSQPHFCWIKVAVVANGRLDFRAVKRTIHGGVAFGCNQPVMAQLAHGIYGEAGPYQVCQEAAVRHYMLLCVRL